MRIPIATQGSQLGLAKDGSPNNEPRFTELCHFYRTGDLKVRPQT